MCNLVNLLITPFNCLLSNFRNYIIIRKPSLHDLKWNVFLLPFSVRLWMAVGATIIVLSISMTIIQRLRLCYEHVNKEDLSIVSSTMLIIAIFLQQGKYAFFSILAKLLSCTHHSILF